jgi:hypothetical protein
MNNELMAILEADLPGQDDAGKLAEVLYSRCYMHSILDPPPAANNEVIDRDLTSVLDAANMGRAVWDAGWRIDQILDGGRILARKGGAARSFLPGEYLTRRGLGAGPVAGKPVGIFLPAGSADMQPGLYYAFGDTAGEFESGEQLLRFYWNVSAEGAPRLVEAVTRELNRFQIAFQFKCGARAVHYPRRDAAVLYLHQRYYAVAALLVERVHQGIAGWLSPGTPLFTRQLAGGLGFAEDPGDSFGKHRCGILAEAMTATRGWPAEERLQEVRRRFEQRGLSLDRPWLNAGSVDRYEFPFPIT